MAISRPRCNSSGETIEHLLQLGLRTRKAQVIIRGKDFGYTCDDDVSHSCFADVTYEIKICNDGGAPAEISTIVLLIKEDEVQDSVDLNPNPALVVEKDTCEVVIHPSTVDVCTKRSYSVKVTVEAVTPNIEVSCVGGGVGGSVLS